MSTEGSKGGDVNRPGSAPEIKKFDRAKCAVCGLVTAAPMIVGGRCKNEIACRLRVERRKEKKS